MNALSRVEAELSMSDFLALAQPGVQKLSPYVPGKPVDELARELGIDPTAIVKLASNENPLGASPKALEAIRAELAELTRYPDGNGFELKRKLAERCAVDAAQVTLGNGSNDILDLVARAYLAPGLNAVFSEHAFAVYPIATQAVGAEGRAVKARAWGHDLEAMLAAIDGQTRVVFVANPNNPTGTLSPHERIVRAIERKPERSVVLVDEAYIHFSDAPSVVGLAVQRQDVLVLRTFSKLYGMAGARLGLAIGHPQLLARLERFGGHNVVPSPTAHAGLESLRDDDLVPRRKQQNAEVRERTIAWLRQQGFRCTASQSNCFMVDMRRPAELVIAELEKQRVHVGRPWASWPNWVRVTVGSEEEMQAFRSAFASVSRRHQVAMR